MYRVKVEIYPQPDGKFALDNGRQIRICGDKHAVGQYLEPDLWPLLEPMLTAKREITITIES